MFTITGCYRAVGQNSIGAPGADFFHKFVATTVYMKSFATSLLLLLTIAGYSQTTLNNYKYVIVPMQFPFSHEQNEYGLNTAAKQFLQQKGFIAYLENESMPLELAANKCIALKAEVTQKKNLFVTNLTLVLKNCQGDILFKGKEGKSREKDFGPAYQEALINAFSSLQEYPYHYDSTAVAPAGAPSGNVAVAPAAQGNVSANPASSAPTAAVVSDTPVEITGTLYAQAIPNGYQLIDLSPKKVLTLLKTSVPDYFIAGNGSANGIVFKKGSDWFFEYYKDNKLVSKKLDVKF